MGDAVRFLCVWRLTLSIRYAKLESIGGIAQRERFLRVCYAVSLVAMMRADIMTENSYSEQEPSINDMSSAAEEYRLNRLAAACSYLKTCELPAVSYRDEEPLRALISDFESTRSAKSREEFWWKIRRYLRRLDGRVSDTQVFEYYARRDFQRSWRTLDDVRRRASITSQLGDESAYRKAPLLKNYALNLASAATFGSDIEKKKRLLIDALASNEEAAFTLSEYTAALDDYGYADVDEVGKYCDALTDFLRQIILSPSFQVCDEQDTKSEETPNGRAPHELPTTESVSDENATSGSGTSDYRQSDSEETDDEMIDKPDGYYQIDEEIAKLAQQANSFREYVPNSATREYRVAVDAARETANKQKNKVAPSFHNRIDSVLETYERRLAQWYDKYHRNAASCPSQMIVGAANLPHERHRLKVRRVGELLQEHEKISDMLSTIMAIGTGGISSDDENAIEKLTEKLTTLKRLHEQMKTANAYRRKHGSWDGYDGPLQDVVTRDGPELYQFFNLPNSSAEIRRIEQRITLLQRNKNADYGDDVQFEGGVVRFNKALNRLQLVFDSKPDEEVRAKLKKRGFKWSMQNKAWQRMITTDAVYAAKDLGYLPHGWKPASIEKQD